MENLRPECTEGSIEIEEDGFYDDIEAPMFVDFTAPDHSSTDDGSWFCVRIGCDQQHEQVDPDALNKSFMLRVMEARSPYLRLRKTWNQLDMRSTSKCPHSAPAKSTMDKTIRFSTATAIPEKMRMTKLKNHPISGLRSTPKSIKAAVVQPLTSERALTTPRHKKYSINQEPFRSVKYQKAPFPAPKNKSVGKALFLDTPSRTVTKSTNPKSDVCAKMEQLKISSQKKSIPRGRLCQSSRCAAYDPNSPDMNLKKGKGSESATGSKKQIEVPFQQKCNNSMLQEGVLHGSSNSDIDGELSSGSISTTNVEEQLSSSVGSNSKDLDETAAVKFTGSDGSRTEPNSEINSENSSNITGNGSESVDNVTDSDSNKENIADICQTRDMNLNTTSSEYEGLRSDTSENLPQKAIEVPSKPLRDNQAPVGKHKRTTNPKPFRLRTDERGILREANLEKRRRCLEARKDTPSILRHADGMQSGARDGQDKSSRGVKLLGSTRQCPNVENSKIRATEDSCNKITKVATMASSRQVLNTERSRDSHDYKSSRIGGVKLVGSTHQCPNVENRKRRATEDSHNKITKVATVASSRQVLNTQRPRDGHDKSSRIGVVKLVGSTHQCPNVENSKRRATEDSNNRITKVASSRQVFNTQSVTAAMKAQIPKFQTRSVLKVATSVKEKTTLPYQLPVIRRNVTSLKEPSCHKAAASGNAQIGNTANPRNVKSLKEPSCHKIIKAAASGKARQERTTNQVHRIIK